MAINKTLIWDVTLSGVTEILFDRYAGDNKVKLAPEQKMYLTAENHLYLPSLNIMSFLSATNTESAPKLLLDKREYKQVASAILSSVTIAPGRVPFLRGGKPIIFGGFDENGRDAKSGIEIVRHVARLKDGIPNVKERPMLGLDWALQFKMTIFPNPDLNEDMLENLFVDGGARLGLGTFRKAFGKFQFSMK